jgi:hypothetical protein
LDSAAGDAQLVEQLDGVAVKPLERGFVALV